VYWKQKIKMANRKPVNWNILSNLHEYTIIIEAEHNIKDKLGAAQRSCWEA
jgi:hypothetical protein